MYLSYEEYREAGGGLPEPEFRAREPDAEAYVSYLTYVNGDIFSDTSDRTRNALRLALAKAVDIVASDAAAASSGTAGIKSESNDGYSISRVSEMRDGETVDELTRRKVLAAIRVYLLPTGWLRRSLRGGCAC